jgi:hypothetical protein
MVEKLTLEWSYTPADFIEEPFEYDEKDYTVEIKNGRVVATFLGAADEQTESLLQRIQPEVNARFLGAQLISNKPYQLSGCTTRRTRRDGTAEVGVSIKSTLHMSVSFDAVLLDAAGNVKVDTRRERIEAQKEFAFLASKHRKDVVARSVLRSHNAAIADPKNELIHLYEIRDALAKRFGGENKTHPVLRITKDEWQRLGYLANHALLAQGRHRGEKIGQLRDATPTEPDEARTIAKHMIRAYLDHLASARPIHTD